MDAAKARGLLVEWGAPSHLMRHVSLVHEVAVQLAMILVGLGVELDGDWVESGALLHDVGKILHPEELHQKGSKHEEAGQALLLEHGVDAHIARVCVSHAQWAEMECATEELVVALADGLWKGKRRPELEELVVRRVADALGVDFWDVFPGLDASIEGLAAEGDARLARSVAPGGAGEHD